LPELSGAWNRFKILCQTCKDIYFKTLEEWQEKLGMVIDINATRNFRRDEYIKGTSDDERLLYYPHKSSWEDLHASVQMNCQFCTLMWAKFERSPRICGSQSNITLCVKVRSTPSVKSGWTLEIDFGAFCLSDWMALRWQILDCKYIPTSSSAKYLLPIPDELGLHMADITMDEGHTNQDSTGSLSNLKLAAFWLQDCLGNHAKCRKRSLSLPPLPKRVVDVGPSDGSTDPFLRVEPGKAPYAVRPAL
jgi:hypothetical protein